MHNVALEVTGLETPDLEELFAVRDSLLVRSSLKLATHGLNFNHFYWRQEINSMGCSRGSLTTVEISTSKLFELDGTIK